MPVVETLSDMDMDRPDKAMWLRLHQEEALVTSEDVLYGVSMVFEHFIERSDRLARIKPTVFDTPADEPDCTVRVRPFLDHIMQSGLCSKECFIMSLVYGERLMQRYPDFSISRRNVHRFVLASVLVGSKIVDDFYCRNVYYAVAGGISKSEVNELELQLCFLLDFELNVTSEEFALYRDSLIRTDRPELRQQHSSVSSLVAPLSPALSDTPPTTPAACHTADPSELINENRFGGWTIAPTVTKINGGLNMVPVSAPAMVPTPSTSTRWDHGIPMQPNHRGVPPPHLPVPIGQQSVLPMHTLPVLPIAAPAPTPLQAQKAAQQSAQHAHETQQAQQTAAIRQAHLQTWEQGVHRYPPTFAEAGTSWKSNASEMDVSEVEVDPLGAACAWFGTSEEPYANGVPRSACLGTASRSSGLPFAPPCQVPMSSAFSSSHWMAMTQQPV